MRNFDNWTCYRDLKGNILRGCVQFNVKGGNTPAPIFDRNGTAIANPQITDILGRTQHQVFIGEDVTAYFYKYVGDGTIAEEEAIGIDTSDESRWALQFTCDNVLAFGASFDSLSAMEIGTMSGLRALDPESVPNVGGVKEIILGGYYEAGDCEQVRYIWDAESVEADDNGSIIKCNDLLTGRWCLVTPTEHCDSRHFGVFPQVSAFSQVDHSTRIAQLVEYCNKVSIRPFFKGSEDTPFFIYSFLNVVCKNAIDVSEGTKFEDKDDSRIVAEFNGNPLFQNGNTDIVTKRCKTSWKYKSVTGYSEVIIDDSSITQKTYTDAKIEVDVDIDGFTFSKCEIRSDGHVGACTLTYCKLVESIFDTSKTPTVDNTDIIDLDDFFSVAFWMSLKNQQTSTTYDMKGRTVDSSCTATRQGIYWKDAVFSSFTYAPGYAVVFDGCTGGVTLDCSNSPTIGLLNSSMDMQWTSGTPALTLTNSSVNNVGTVMPCGDITARMSSLTGNQVTAASINFSHCDISAPLSVGGSFSAEWCAFGGSSLTHVQSGTIHTNLQHCSLSVTYEIAGGVLNTVVNATIVGNHSSASPAISIVRANLKAKDSEHYYIYRDNTGTFIKDKTEPKGISATVHIFPQLIAELESEAGALKLGRMEQGSGLFVFNRTVNFDTAEFFRIGTDAFDVNMEIAKFGMNTARGYDNNVVCGKATLEAVFVSGFTWGLRVHLVDPSDPTSNVSYNTVLTTSLPSATANTEYTQALEVQYENLEKHI